MLEDGHADCVNQIVAYIPRNILVTLIILCRKIVLYRLVADSSPNRKAPSVISVIKFCPRCLNQFSIVSWHFEPNQDIN